MEYVKVISNFVDETDCDEMIAHLDQLVEKGDVIVRDDGRIGIINKEDEVFLKYVEKYQNKAIATFQDQFTVFNGYIATLYNPGIGMHTHLDSQPNEEIGVLMYLNDDYEGGELIFTTPDGKDHAYAAKKGDMIYCPSWYPHGVNKVISGKRYFFTVSLLANS